MAYGISSNEAVAAAWKATMTSSKVVADLEGVDDDNTLAESGIYNSMNALKGRFGQLLAATNADAANLESAAYALAVADASSARIF